MISFQEIHLGWPFAFLGPTDDILVSFFRDDREVCKGGAWYPVNAVARCMMIMRTCIGFVSHCFVFDRSICAASSSVASANAWQFCWRIVFVQTNCVSKAILAEFLVSPRIFHRVGKLQRSNNIPGEHLLSSRSVTGLPLPC